MKSVIGGLITFALLLAAATTAFGQTMKLGEVLVFYIPDLKADADTKAFESYVVNQMAPAWRKNAPGMNLTLVKKDRGPRAGQYMLVWTTDTITRHKGYGASGDVPFNSALMAKVGDYRQGLAPFVQTGGKYIEYHLVGPDKVGAALPEVDLLGNHYIKVRPDRVAAFDQFVAGKLHPTVGNLRPDLRLLYYKPIRGEESGNYVTVFALTKASRDKYWPKGSDSDELKATFSKPVTALTEELRTYLVDGSYATGNLAAAVYESRDWADWVIVSG